MAEPLDELTAQRARMTALLKNVGEAGVCRGCAAAITWVPHRATQKWTPYDLDGTNHFITCPKAENFRKKKE
jgi:hypothetical protein